MKFRFALEGAEGVENIGSALEGAMDIVLGQVFVLVHDIVVNRTPVDVTTKKGRAKSFGEHLQESWVFDVAPDARSATVATDFVYAPVLEFGKYRGVGPRTAVGDGGIYSRQAVGGMLRPLVDDPTILGDAIDMVVSELDKRIDRLVKRT